MCRQQNLHHKHYRQLHLEVPLMPMHFIVMDLIGELKPSPQRTSICFECYWYVGELHMVHTAIYKGSWQSGAFLLS